MKIKWLEYEGKFYYPNKKNAIWIFNCKKVDKYLKDKYANSD